MNKVLTVPNTTLQNSGVDHNSEEIPSVDKHDEDRQSRRKSLSMPKVATPTNTTRLMRRINRPREDCMKDEGHRYKHVRNVVQSFYRAGHKRLMNGFRASTEQLYQLGVMVMLCLFTLLELHVCLGRSWVFQRFRRSSPTIQSMGPTHLTQQHCGKVGLGSFKIQIAWRAYKLCCAVKTFFVVRKKRPLVHRLRRKRIKRARQELRVRTFKQISQRCNYVEDVMWHKRRFVSDQMDNRISDDSSNSNSHCSDTFRVMTKDGIRSCAKDRTIESPSVQEGSPGHKAGLEAFFDFIVAIGNTRLNQDNDTLKELLRNNVERPLKVTVYSSKTQSVREVNLVPSHNWGGQGLLGVSIRFCSFEGANENVWHILEVQPNSPADLAGLRSDTDFVIGADSVLHESEDLFTLIESHEGKALKLYVYNTETDACREVTITPNGAWGGKGSLGCNIGYGYLHRIPKRQFPSNQSKTVTNVVTPTAPPPSPPRDGFSEASVVPLTGSPHQPNINSGLAQLSLNTGAPTIPVIPQHFNLPSPLPSIPSGLPHPVGIPNLTNLPGLTNPISLTGILPAAASVGPLPSGLSQFPSSLPAPAPLPNFALPTTLVGFDPAHVVLPGINSVTPAMPSVPKNVSSTAGDSGHGDHHGHTHNDHGHDHSHDDHGHGHSHDHGHACTKTAVDSQSMFFLPGFSLADFLMRMFIFLFQLKFYCLFNNSDNVI
ncbi:Golgi reassembly-stacking protein 2 [Bulinus truncatus]|nr:Golgi reassembly-stacking protein 2 [Bulinus truncatus]